MGGKVGAPRAEASALRAARHGPQGHGGREHGPRSETLCPRQSRGRSNDDRSKCLRCCLVWGTWPCGPPSSQWARRKPRPP
eukprot:13904961-Alexandrium_andersonii.AAC.1